jgi:phospho-N-acetylmuramoyl-pentapeptide-transferase
MLPFGVAGAAVTAFLISVIFGPYVIRRLRKAQVIENTQKTDSERLSEIQKVKSETPTMGGLLILLAILGSTIFWADPFENYILLGIFIVVGLGVIGGADDLIKLRPTKEQGLPRKLKLILEALLGLSLAVLLWYYVRKTEFGTKLSLPFRAEDYKNYIELGLLYFVLVAIVIVGTSNAVNLADGLDGLAIGCVIMVALGFAVVSYVVGHYKFSHYLLVPFVRGASEISIFSAAIAGAGLGFLWFNCHPAQVFMGDVGALPLGGAIGYISVVARQEFLLFFIGGVFVLEAVSVILQVASYRLTGKRIFLIAPLHHHFQFKGWPENKITARFWILSAVCAAIGVATLKLR